MVLARSFGRIFYRNAMNLGLPALVCPGLDTVRTGEELRIDMAGGVVENLSAARVLACEPISPHLVAMLEDGGLLGHLEKRLRRGPTWGSAVCRRTPL